MARSLVVSDGYHTVLQEFTNNDNVELYIITKNTTVKDSSIGGIMLEYGKAHLGLDSDAKRAAAPKLYVLWSLKDDHYHIMTLTLHADTSSLPPSLPKTMRGYTGHQTSTCRQAGERGGVCLWPKPCPWAGLPS